MSSDTSKLDDAVDEGGARRRPSGPLASRRRRLLRLASALVVLLVVGVVVQRGSREEATEPEGPAPVPADYPFGPDSIWRTSIREAPVADNSAAMVEGLVEQVDDHWGGVASFNVDQYTASWYTVPADQPTVDVAWNNCQKKGWTPDDLLGEGGQFSDIPIPQDAEQARGSDGQLTIYSPSQDKLWELWRVERTDEGWSACWGGRIDDVSSNPGWFSDGYGASASGLAMSAGTVWADDVRAGRINHALGLAIMWPATWDQVSWPAQRSDGNNDDADAIPEGTRLRLPADVDVESLGLTPLATLVAHAAQDYGFIVTDQAGAVNVGAQVGGAIADDPDFWAEQMDGVPSYQVLADFPWEQLEALPQNWGEKEWKARQKAE